MTETVTQPATLGLLSAVERRQIERLRFAPRRRFAGRVRGERISRQKGHSIEFSDFRDYSVGDDLRRLDWSILARLDRPTIRTFQDEDDLAVYVLLDCSASMDFGTPTKHDVARKAAAAFGLIGLLGQDAVYLLELGHAGRRKARALRGRGNASAVDRWASNSKATGSVGLADALTQFAYSGNYRPGLAIVISDGLDAAARQAIRAVGARGHEVLIVQTLSALELDPEMEGDLRLLDSESGDVVDITAHSEVVRIYKENLNAHCEDLADAALKSGGRYMRILSHESVVDVCVRELRRLGALEQS